MLGESPAVRRQDQVFEEDTDGADQEHRRSASQAKQPGPWRKNTLGADSNLVTPAAPWCQTNSMPDACCLNS